MLRFCSWSWRLLNQHRTITEVGNRISVSGNGLNNMATEDRTFSIGTCSRELEKIQDELQGLSRKLDQPLTKPAMISTMENHQGSRNEGGHDFTLLVTCSNEEFDEKIKMMKIVDIEMAIITFEEQIQIACKLNSDTQVGNSHLSHLREKLTKCFIRKTELYRRQTRALEITQPMQSDADENEEVAAIDDITCLSFVELEALLYYNGVQYDEKASKDTLVSLVRGRILEIDDEVADDWEPPGESELNWTLPSEFGEAEVLERNLNEGAHYEDFVIKKQKFEADCERNSNEKESNDDDDKNGDKRVKDGNRIEDSQESSKSIILGQKSDDLGVEFGCALSKTPQEDDRTSPGQQPVAEIKGESSVNACVDQIQNGDREKNNYYPVMEREEGSVIEWDPTPILKDLYSVIKAPESISFDKDKAKDQTNEQGKSRLEGYLEKLPVNQTKATLLKGWKKRYFRIKHGKIFYYQDHYKEHPLGSILLTGSDLKVIGDREIQLIAQNTGNLMNIRCSSSNETNDWYRMIKRESAISNPVTAPVKVPSQLEGPSRSDLIIIDLGASTIRGGFVGEEKPRVVFPAVYAVKKEGNGGRKFTESGLPDPSMCKCGYEALTPEVRKNSKLIFPLRPTLKVDKFAVKTRYIPGFIDKVLKDLGVDAQNSTVIIICQRYFADKDKEIIFDHLFGHLGVSAVYAEQQALLSLYSYKDTTGVIVDVGEHIDVLPVVEDCIIEKGSSSIPQGGQLVTENLARLLSEGGYRFFSEVESYIVRYVKEKTAFVALDHEKELEVKTSNENVDVVKYNLPGKQRSITVSSERFRCTEGLFDPNKWGKDYEGVHKLVEKAIKQSGIDQRKELCRKIFLSGGTTMIEGFQERLQKELKFLMPETVTITVHAAENRANAAFKGATVIAEQPTFSRSLVDKENWLDHGVDIFKRMTSP